MVRFPRGVVCLYLCLFLGTLILCRVVHRAREASPAAPPAPPPAALPNCVNHREIRYCVTAWNRDWWNVNARAAIGAAAHAWNQVGPYQFREVYCNDPHDLPIFFEWGVHADGHSPEGWPDNVLAHATFPNNPSRHQFIHFRDDLAWWQAQDTLGWGYDMQSVALHEMGHTLGLEHDLSGNSIMTPYAVRHAPLQNDIDRVWQNAKTCGIELSPPALELTAPTPGATWRYGYWYTVAWDAPSLEGSVQVVLYRYGALWAVLNAQAPSSGRLSVLVDGSLPLGPGYEVVLWHPQAGRVYSSMILIAP